MRPQERLMIPLTVVLAVAFLIALGNFIVRADSLSLQGLVVVSGLFSGSVGFTFGSVLLRRAETGGGERDKQ